LRPFGAGRGMKSSSSDINTENCNGRSRRHGLRMQGARRYSSTVCNNDSSVGHRFTQLLLLLHCAHYHKLLPIGAVLHGSTTVA